MRAVRALMTSRTAVVFTFVHATRTAVSRPLFRACIPHAMIVIITRHISVRSYNTTVRCDYDYKSEFECDFELLLLYKCDFILSDCEYECDLELLLLYKCDLIL